MRGRLDAVAAVQPAVGPPLQAVGDVVADAVVVEAVEQHLRLAVGAVVAVGVGDEEQARRAQREHAAVADGDAGEFRALVPEHRALVAVAVALAVGEDQDAVAQLVVEVGVAVAIGVVLGHPQAATTIPGHGDGLADRRFRRVQRGGEAGGQGQAAQRLLGRGQRVADGRLGVEGHREVIGGVQGGGAGEQGESGQEGEAVHGGIRRGSAGCGPRVCDRVVPPAGEKVVHQSGSGGGPGAFRRGRAPTMVAVVHRRAGVRAPWRPRWARRGPWHRDRSLGGRSPARPGSGFSASPHVRADRRARAPATRRSGP